MPAQPATPAEATSSAPPTDEVPSGGLGEERAWTTMQVFAGTFSRLQGMADSIDSSDLGLCTLRTLRAI